ncbi:hypothetical protein Tco_0445424 [Tanacetum coccineum]
METIHVQFDELTEHMAPVHISTGPEPIFSSSSCFGRSAPSSITIDQDASLTGHLPPSSEVQPPISHKGVAAGPTIEDNPFDQAEDNPFVNVFSSEPSSEESSSRDVSSAESNQIIQPHNHLRKWSKDHPLDNIMWIYKVLDEYGDVLKTSSNVLDSEGYFKRRVSILRGIIFSNTGRNERRSNPSQPEGFVNPDHPTHKNAYHLKKALYGLKQASMTWYSSHVSKVLA